jgi:hypothetical protein
MRLISVRLVALLIVALPLIPSPAFAAPTPKRPELTSVELKLSADNQNELRITIQNNGREPLELPYRVTPFEHLVVELRGENGKQYKVPQRRDQVEKGEPSTLTIPAGQSTTLSLHTCHYLPALGEGEQKVTFIARLNHDGRTIESKPLTVKP